ncbi:MAG: spermidine synthase, partial [Planctomycetota bacterium]
MYGSAPEHLLLVISGAAFAAAVIIGYSLSRRWVAGTLLAAAISLLAFNPTGPLALAINISQHKSLVWYRELPDAQLTAARYSPLARLDTVRAPTIRNFPGLSLTFAGRLPEQMLIINDADGTSAVNKFESFSDLECYDYMTSSLAYHLASEPEVCIIGAGGGSDVAQALSLGADKVTAVEMNAQIIDLVHNTFNEFASDLFRRDDVQIIAAEGRSFLQTTAEWFDVISISLLDSFSASAAGLYALNESHLYTVEAVEQALLRLWPQGLLSITRVLK